VRRIFFLVLVLIVYGSLYPWVFVPRHVPGGPIWFLLHRWDAWWNPYLKRDIFANVVIYVPLGLSGRLAFRNRSSLAVVLFAVTLSISVELIQVYEPLRQSSMADVLCNTGGAALGVTLGVAVAALSRRRVTDLGAALLASGFLVWLLFPLVPLHSSAMIRQNTDALVHSPLVSAFPGTAALAIWYAAGVLLRSAGVRYPRVWLTISLLTIAAQLHIIARAPLISELAGATAGVILFALRPPPRITVWEALGFTLLTAIGALWPFHFSGTAHSFSMVPFEDLIPADGPTGLWIILSQLVAWGTAIWLFNAAGMRRWSAVALVAGLVAAAQAARIFVPGATPGITAPLIAVIAGYVLMELRNAQAEGLFHIADKATGQVVE
jgi:hypothetical protein